MGALLHDASEAYLVDVPRPIKLQLSNYKEIEDSIMRVISKKFGFTYPLSSEVKHIDEIMLQLEWDNFVTKEKNDLIIYSDPKSVFLNQFKLLTQ